MGPNTKEPARAPASPGVAAPAVPAAESPARVLARATAALVLTEAASAGLVLAALVGPCGWPRPTSAAVGRLALFSLAIGLGGGLALGAAQVARGGLRGARGLLAGVLAGAGLAALVPLLGDLALHLVDAGTPVAALQALAADLPTRPLLPLALFAAVGVALHLPLAAGRGLAATAWAMVCGVVVVGAAGALLRGRLPWLAPDALPLLAYAALLVPRCALVPLGLRLGDRGIDRLRAAALGEEAVAGRPGEVAPAARGLGGRRAAQRHAARGDALLDAARPAEAALELDKAFTLWPTAQLGVALAQARAETGDLDGAAAALTGAAALARGGMPLVVDPRDPAWEPARGHAAFDEALAGAAAAAAGGQVDGPRAGLGLLAALCGCLASSAALLLLLAAVRYPGEVADVTLDRAEAWRQDDGARWTQVGDRLRHGVGSPSPRVGLPAALLRVGLREPDSPAAEEAALACYERAAALDHGPGARQAAELLDQRVGRRKDAALLWRRGAERGDPRSMREWARSLRLGLGVPSDTGAAVAWAERAADAGEAAAWTDLARWAAGEGDVAAVRSWLDRAAAAGVDVTELRAALAPE